MDIIKKLRSCYPKVLFRVETIRDMAVDDLSNVIQRYSDWYENHGLYLPPDYATDPAKWTTDLQKIKRAFLLLNEEMHGEGELWEAKNKWKEYGEVDVEKLRDLEKEITEGMTIFGKQLFYLTDKREK